MRNKYNNTIIGERYIQAFEYRKLKFNANIHIYDEASDPKLLKECERIFNKVMKSLKKYSVRYEDIYYER